MRIGYGLPFLVCCVAVSTLSRAAEPSVAETASWVQQTFSNGSHDVNNAVEDVEFIRDHSFRYCWLIFTVSEKMTGQPRFFEVVDLADIDPNSLRTSGPIHDTDLLNGKNHPERMNPNIGIALDHPYVWVTMRTANGSNRVTSYATNRMSPSAGKHQHYVGFSEGIALEPEYAPSFVRALHQAVESCGKPAF